MLVYVINKHGKPLMPCKPQKARRLLQEGRAKVMRRTPFTVQLLYGSSGYRQPVSLGVDTGAKYVGVAAVRTDEKGRAKNTLLQGECQLRADIRGKMDRRRSYRRTRRGRKTRYRKPRFDNRRRPEGWLAPSIQSRVDGTLKVTDLLRQLLPVTSVEVETAQFDTAAMARGVLRLRPWQYQRGEQYQFENVKSYVRHRDGYRCRQCKAKGRPLEVHHIRKRADGGTDRPANLITLCEGCHDRVHKGGIKLTAVPGRTNLRYAAHTQAGKTALVAALRERLPTSETTGAVTKVDRLEMGLSKTHAGDALAIAATGVPVEPVDTQFFMRCIPKGNYRLFKGARSHIRNQSARELFGFRRLDKVCLPGGQEGFVKGKRTSGYFNVSTLDGTVISASISYKRLRLLEKQTSLLVERRQAVSMKDTRLVLTATVVTVGSEIVEGIILNSNARYLSLQLQAANIRVLKHVSVDDDPSELTEALKEAIKETDVVVVTGGLGPTEDDITREAAASALGVGLTQDREMVEQIERYFRDRHLTMSENNLRQAMSLEGGEALTNDRGTAPGQFVLLDGSQKALVLLPGPPSEMAAMYEKQAQPRLERFAMASGRAVQWVSKQIHFFGLGESELARRLEGILPAGQRDEGLKIATMASGGTVTLRLGAASGRLKLLRTAGQAVHRALGEYVYGEDTDTLPGAVGRGLIERGLKMAIAESCTGGLLGYQLTTVAGSSDYFIGGIQAYSNGVKKDVLGVTKSIFLEDGAVSPQCAEAMALGVINTLKADIGASITGIAGPGGGSPEKPVGTVWFAVAGPDGTVVDGQRFQGDRDTIRRRAATHCLGLVWKSLCRNHSNPSRMEHSMREV